MISLLSFMSKSGSAVCAGWCGGGWWHGTGAAIGNVYSIFMQVDQNHVGSTQRVWYLVSESQATALVL